MKHASFLALIYSIFTFVVLSGCAFAQFKSKEAAEQCIAASHDESEVMCNAE